MGETVLDTQAHADVPRRERRRLREAKVRGRGLLRQLPRASVDPIVNLRPQGESKAKRHVGVSVCACLCACAEYIQIRCPYSYLPLIPCCPTKYALHRSTPTLCHAQKTPSVRESMHHGLEKEKRGTEKALHVCTRYEYCTHTTKQAS